VLVLRRRITQKNKGQEKEWAEKKEKQHRRTPACESVQTQNPQGSLQKMKGPEKKQRNRPPRKHGGTPSVRRRRACASQVSGGVKNKKYPDRRDERIQILIRAFVTIQSSNQNGSGTTSQGCN